MNVTAIIPARGGSKGLKNKNIRNFAGHPLIHYAISAAKQSKLVNKIIVSTDSPEIKLTSENCGAEAPFLRPAKLSNDTASLESALKHAVDFLENEQQYFSDIIIYLSATEVFRKKNMIDTVAKALINDEKLDSAFWAHPTHKKFWKDNGQLPPTRLSSRHYKPRQKSMPLLREDTGLACAIRPRVIKANERTGNNVLIFKNNDEYSGIDIHDEKTLWLANAAFNYSLSWKTNPYIILLENDI
jgi:CMP-N-acetylneuraminic acid synthetase